MNLILIDSIEKAKKEVKSWKEEGLKIGIVPTMGALHEGHESLIMRARGMCDKLVVSIFINPIQFGANEDYDKYPRTLEHDIDICENLDVDIIFAPSPKEMYGEIKSLSNNDLTFVCPAYNIVDCMCGKSRPGHFDGVATVVTKLFNIFQPDFAFFGEKDAQQLFIINKMVKDLNMNTKIVACPIIREKDGLAQSSRNTYLSPDERKKALTINKALKQVEALYLVGVTDTKTLLESALSILDKDLDLEYLEFRDFDTFEQVEEVSKNTLIAIAVKAGNTRLIDNIITKE